MERNHEYPEGLRHADLSQKAVLKGFSRFLLTLSVHGCMCSHARAVPTASVITSYFSDTRTLNQRGYQSLHSNQFHV